MSSSPTLGVDFGCTRTLAAYVNSEGMLVSLGRKTHGVPQDSSAAASPVKRYLGRKPEIRIGAKKISPAEAAALMLKELKSRSEETLGRPVEKIVLAVPLHFQDNQVLALREAAKLAGFELLDLVDEATAAALAFHFRKKKQGRIAVYDWGGGMFNAAVLEVRNSTVKVLGHAGDPDLGGEDLTARLAGKILGEIRANFGKEAAEDPGIAARAREEAEKVKCAVSHRGSCDVRLSDPAKKIHYARAFSRFEVGNLVHDLVQKTIFLCEKAMKKAQAAPDQVEEVLLAGGSTRIPLVREMIRKTFGKEPHSGMNPEEAVAFGAAVRAALLSGVPQGQSR